jgi:hypothetical protein
MRNGGIWIIIWHHRLLESVTPGLPLKLSDLSLPEIVWIGRHARDVLDKFARQCQSHDWIIDITKPILPPDIWDLLNPWHPKPPKPEPDPLPWFDPEPLMDIALGGAIVAIREEFPDPNNINVSKAEQDVEALIEKGAKIAVTRSSKSLEQSSKMFNDLNRSL